MPFVGFDVDPNAMTISINDERQAKLFEQVATIAKPGKRHTLREFQSLAGYINWLLSTRAHHRTVYGDGRTKYGAVRVRTVP